MNRKTPDVGLIKDAKAKGIIERFVPLPIEGIINHDAARLIGPIIQIGK
jgi:hypothetical protein